MPGSFILYPGARHPDPVAIDPGSASNATSDLANATSELAQQAASFLDLGVLGYLLVFASSVGEALPLVGFVVPGQWVALAGGFAAQQGYYSLTAMLAVVIVGGVVGDAIGYHVGRTHGRAVLAKWGPRFRLDNARVEQAQRFLEDYGPIALILARFTMVTRSLGPLLAGLNDMRPRLFWPVNVAGAILWGATYVLIGYAFGESTRLLAKALGGTAIGIIVVGIVAAVVATALARRRRRRKKARLQAGP